MSWSTEEFASPRVVVVREDTGREFLVVELHTGSEGTVVFRMFDHPKVLVELGRVTGKLTPEMAVSALLLKHYRIDPVQALVEELARWKKVYWRVTEENSSARSRVRALEAELRRMKRGEHVGRNS